MNKLDKLSLLNRALNFYLIHNGLLKEEKKYLKDRIKKNDAKIVNQHLKSL